MVAQKEPKFLRQFFIEQDALGYCRRMRSCALRLRDEIR